jgi:hypothetical protein
MAISNIFIMNVLRNEKNFLGVYSSNELENIFLNEEQNGIIINLSDKYDVGSHFIAVYRKADSLIYFDSLALNILTEDICRFLKKHNSIIKFYNYRIQPLYSDLCGYYCISFILAMKNMSINMFYKQFYLKNNAICTNDVLVLQLINRMNK